MSTKIDLINEAYSRGRISGLTSQPSGDDIGKALRRLENMAAIWEANNLPTGYNFEDDPDSSSIHNVPRKYWTCFESNLAMSILADFGKQPHEMLVNEARASFNMMATDLAVVTPCQYPNRMPLGKGNYHRRGRWDNYFYNLDSVPNESATVQLYEGDIEDLVEHFDSYLKNLEDVLSYTIASDVPSGLTISDDTLSSPDISYRATANTEGIYRVTITATTSLGRVTTRKINFIVLEA